MEESMKTFKTYLLSLLAVASMAPLAAMEAPLSPKHAVKVNIALLKNIESEMHGTLNDMVPTLRRIIDTNSRKDITFNKTKKLNDLANQLSELTMGDFKSLFNSFIAPVQEFERSLSSASIDTLRELAAQAMEQAKEAQLFFKKANAKARKNFCFSDEKDKPLPLTEVQTFINTAEERLYRKPVKRDKSVAMRNRVFAAVGVPAGLAVTGYAVLRCLAPTVSASVETGAMPTVIIPQAPMPEIIIPQSASIAPVASAAISGNIDTYGWLAGQAVNPFQ